MVISCPADLVSDAVSLSQVDVAFNVLDLSVVGINWCRFPSSRLSSTCSFCVQLSNVSVFIWSFPFFISYSAASISHDVISGTSFGSVCRVQWLNDRASDLDCSTLLF